MNPTTSKLAALLGSASLLTMAGAMAAQAQTQTAQAGAQEVPEQVLVTGSLIHGTAAVGVPVTNLSPRDFAQTGALTTADLFRTIPAANTAPSTPSPLRSLGAVPGTLPDARSHSAWFRTSFAHNWALLPDPGEPPPPTSSCARRFPLNSDILSPQ